MLLNIPESFASNVLPSQQAMFTSVFPGCPPGTAVRFDPDSYGVFALPWDPNSVCAFYEWGLGFSQSLGAPVHKPHWPAMPDAPGALSPSARSPHVEFDMRLLTLTPVGESL